MARIVAELFPAARVSRTLLFAMAILAGGGSAAAMAADSWRAPEGKIITVGMSKAEVLVYAGPPDYSEVISCPEGGIQRSAFYYLIDAPPNRQAVTIEFQGTRVERIDTEIIR